MCSLPLHRLCNGEATLLWPETDNRILCDGLESVLQEVSYAILDAAADCPARAALYGSRLAWSTATAWQRRCAEGIDRW